MPDEIVAWGRKVVEPIGDIMVDAILARSIARDEVGRSLERNHMSKILLLDLNILHPPFRLFHFNRGRRILVVLEPRVVNPLLHKIWFRKLFGRVAVISRDQVILGNEEVLRFGTLVDRETTQAECAHSEQVPREDSTVALVNENKFSFVSGSLYKYRSEAIKSISNSSSTLKLAGKNWDKRMGWHFLTQAKCLLITLIAGVLPDLNQFQLPLSKLTLSQIHYAGRVESSVNFMRTAKYALVIENDASYVSEKLFNAILAGCVPIYVGPDLARHGIPVDVAIPYNGNASGLGEFIEGIQDASCRSALLQGKAWISEKATHDLWGRRQTANRLAFLLD
jgi:hypothetical protein